MKDMRTKIVGTRFGAQAQGVRDIGLVSPV